MELGILPVLLASAVLTFLALSGFFWFWAKHHKRGGSKSREVNKLAGALHSKDVQAEILINSISDGIIVVDTNSNINLANKAAADMTGWPLDEILGLDAKLVLKLSADEKTTESIPGDRHPFAQVLSQKQRFSQTLQLLKIKGDKIFISLVISPVILPKTDELVGAVAVFRDVTAEKSDEQRRAEFISTASHEMRTPVAAIEGYLALALNDKVSKIDASARNYLNKAHASTQNLGKLFQDLLTSAKAEDGRLTSHPVITEMSAFVEQLVEDLRFTAEKKGLTVELVVNSTQGDSNIIDTSGGMKTVQPLYYCHIDPDRIREVITNLFDNAVKYTEQGKVSLGLTGNDEVVQVRVNDTGPGIQAEDLPHLFQKFYRVDNSATRSIGGTGLGLFICRKIVEMYQGTIWAESKVGEGSTFYINLPRLSSDRAQQLKSQENTNQVI
ncbi:PAS domain-containing protein [Candidatus Parcubacteria bacterium]|nr:PAS domain-containing protein [Candidatus Parcubacteria bacterium]